MKILHIAAGLGSGGTERQLVEALKFLTSQKAITCELIVMSDDIHYEYIKDIKIKTYKSIRKFKKDFSIFFQFYKIFKNSKPDIIHSWNSMCSVYAAPVAKMLGIKFINNFLQDAPPRLCIKDKAWLRARLTFPFSDKIAANSYAGLKAYKVPTSKSICLHNGFDFKRLERLDSKESVIKQLNIRTRRVVGMVASFTKKKDYASFINAAHMTLGKRNDVTFIAVGDGECFKRIKKMVKPEFEDRIRFAGKQKRVLNIVNIMDIGILATFTEGISNSIMEYMALKKPVIATDCEGNRELIENQKTGFLVAPENAKQIHEKIMLLLNNERLAEQLGRNGCEKLKSEFSLDVMGTKFLKLYRELKA